MIELPRQIKNSVYHFSRLPGVGEKSALRQVMSMLRWNEAELNEFANALSSLGSIQYCRDCGMFSDDELCSVCKNPHRHESKIICVVENANDLMAIEKSNEFNGLYQILGGVLNPLAGIGPDQLNIDALFRRVKDEKVETVILALNPSVEGDATCAYIKHLLGEETKVERIGFGVPIGGSLEFLDPMTIMKALENRKSF